MRISESNMEHYRNDILNISKCGDSFGVLIENGKVVICKNTDCDRCTFYRTLNCGVTKILWLMEDYKEPIVLTAKEKCFLELAETGWLTRDEDGEIKSHTSKPRKLETCWTSGSGHFGIRTFSEELFSFITWKDEEPWSVEELRKLEVKDE